MKVEGECSCLESIKMHVQQTLLFPWESGYQCSLQLLIQPWICAPGTHYGWVDHGKVEYEVCSTHLHMPALGSNPTPDLESNTLSAWPCATVPSSEVLRAILG